MAVRRMVQAGAVPITWIALSGEWQRDWARELTLADTVKSWPSMVVEAELHSPGKRLPNFWELPSSNTAAWLVFPFLKKRRGQCTKRSASSGLNGPSRRELFPLAAGVASAAVPGRRSRMLRQRRSLSRPQRKLSHHSRYRYPKRPLTTSGIALLPRGTPSARQSVTGRRVCLWIRRNNYPVLGGSV